MQLILVRHALPERVEHDDGTRADPGLTGTGRAQAGRLVRALAAEPLDALYTSTMRRAVETAAPLAAARALDPVARADLCEYDAERSAYVPIGQLAGADPESWERMRAGHLPREVDAETFVQRVHAGIEEVVAAHPGRATAVVVAHAGVVNAYLATILGTGRTLPFPLDYTGVTRVLCARDGLRKARTVNEVSHVADLL